MASRISCTPASPARALDWQPRPAQIASRPPGQSRGRDVARAHRGTVIGLEDPGRSFVELHLRSPDDAAPDQVLDQFLDHVSMCAQDRVVEFAVLDELVSPPQAGALGEM